MLTQPPKHATPGAGGQEGETAWDRSPCFMYSATCLLWLALLGGATVLTFAVTIAIMQAM